MDQTFSQPLAPAAPMSTFADPPVSLVIASQPPNYSAFTFLAPGVCRELS